MAERKNEVVSKEEFDQWHRGRIQEMRDAGIVIVQVLSSPNADQQCEACLAMNGQQIEIEFASDLPLPGCTQEVCGCVWLAIK